MAGIAAFPTIDGITAAMDMTVKAAETARRNLVQRLERYLDAAQKEGKVLGPWETDLLCRVIAHLETGKFRVGEDVMLQVERADLYCSAKALDTVASGPTLTLAEVRGSMARVLGGL